MSALPHVIKADMDEILFRVYLTDTALSFITAMQQGGERPARYYDMIHPAPEETRTADEIIDNVRKKLRDAGEKG